MTTISRIGFLADTHWRKSDGSDLSDQVLEAFAGVDLIVHLGDIGRKPALDRLGEIAPVMVPFGDNKGYVRAGSDDAPVKALSAGSHTVGLVFSLAQPDKKISIGEDGVPVFPDLPVEGLLVRRFKQPVDVVAFGGTHVQFSGLHEGVLFFNPGSPTLPSDKRGDGDLGSVAVLNLSGAKPKVDLVRLSEA